MQRYRFSGSQVPKAIRLPPLLQPVTVGVDTSVRQVRREGYHAAGEHLRS